MTNEKVSETRKESVVGIMKRRKMETVRIQLSLLPTLLPQVILLPALN